MSTPEQIGDDLLFLRRAMMELLNGAGPLPARARLEIHCGVPDEIRTFEVFWTPRGLQIALDGREHVPIPGHTAVYHLAGSFPLVQR